MRKSSRNALRAPGREREHAREHGQQDRERRARAGAAREPRTGPRLERRARAAASRARRSRRGARGGGARAQARLSSSCARSRSSAREVRDLTVPRRSDSTVAGLLLAQVEQVAAREDQPVVVAQPLERREQLGALLGGDGPPLGRRSRVPRGKLVGRAEGEPFPAALALAAGCAPRSRRSRAARAAAARRGGSAAAPATPSSARPGLRPRRRRRCG